LQVLDLWEEAALPTRTEEGIRLALQHSFLIAAAYAPPDVFKQPEVGKRSFRLRFTPAGPFFESRGMRMVGFVRHAHPAYLVACLWAWTMAFRLYIPINVILVPQYLILSPLCKTTNFVDRAVAGS
jgi:hypothetical protein